MSQLVSALEQLELVSRKPLDRLPPEQIDKLAQAAGLIVAITDPTV